MVLPRADSDESYLPNASPPNTITLEILGLLCQFSLLHPLCVIRDTIVCFCVYMYRKKVELSMRNYSVKVPEISFLVSFESKKVAEAYANICANNHGLMVNLNEFF